MRGWQLLHLSRTVWLLLSTVTLRGKLLQIQWLRWFKLYCVALEWSTSRLVCDQVEYQNKHFCETLKSFFMV